MKIPSKENKIPHDFHKIKDQRKMIPKNTIHGMYVMSMLAFVFSSTTSEPNPPQWPNNDKSKVLVVTPEDCLDEAKVKMLQEHISDPYNADSVNVGTTSIPKGTFTSKNHFSRKRQAVLFTPGRYSIDLQVGYYSQVLGVGSSANDVVFEDVKKGDEIIEERYGVFVPALDRHAQDWGLCLNTFWRGAENFSSNVTGRSRQYSGLDQKLGMQWAVSQAAPLRRVHAHQGLTLGDGGAYSSGGFMANMIVEGVMDAVAQQQFFHRNVQFKTGIQNGAWSLVFSGCTDQDNQSYPVSNSPKGTNRPAITVSKVPSVRMEKPFIVLKKDKMGFELHVPKPFFHDAANKRGPSWRSCCSRVVRTMGPSIDDDEKDRDVRDFSRVRVVRSDEADPTFRIQEALDQGKDVVLAAGIFYLTCTIEIKKSNQVILGIGMATMIAPPDGSPCIHVQPFSSGVRLAGITLEPSERNSTNESYNGVSSLLEWGTEGVDDPGNALHPGGLFDLFCRVGGDTDGDRAQIYVDTMVRLHSGNVIGDNLWLWRADHAKLRPGETSNYPSIDKDLWQTEEHEFQVKRSGLDVIGDDITIYGLAVEHANGHQTVWKGDRGTVVFYQCELPYGVSQTSFGEPGYRGYLVEGDRDGMTQHTVYAPGVYSNFRNTSVAVGTAIQTPEHLPLSINKISKEERYLSIINPFTVLLDNNFG